MKLIIKIGGFLFKNENAEKLIIDYAEIANEIHSQGNNLAIIVGGGRHARAYIEAARRLGGTEDICDQIGILASRINALLFISSIGDAAAPVIPNSLQEAIKLYYTDKIIVTGGLTPAQSTNAVAALLAESLRANLLIHLTDVDGVYDKDPKKFSDAKKLDYISTDRLKELISPSGIQAGQFVLLDPTALGVIERSKLKVQIANGKDPQNIKRILKGEKIGTTIKL